MKKLLLTFGLFLGFIGILFSSSCDKDNKEDDKIRNAHLTASITGDYSQSIDVDIVPSAGQVSAVGSYSPNNNLLSINFTESATWFINLLTSSQSGIATGTYDLANPAGFSTYFHANSGANSGFFPFRVVWLLPKLNLPSPLENQLTDMLQVLSPAFLLPAMTFLKL